MNSPLRYVLSAVAVLAATSFLRAQTVTTAGEIATLTIGPLVPFTATCSVTDIAGGWKVLYPDRAQAGLADGKQSFVYTTVDGTPFTVERQIEETPELVRITDSFSDEAGALQLAKTFDVELQADAMGGATVEFIEGDKPGEDGKPLSEVAENLGRASVKCSGLSLATPSGEKLTIQFDEPRSMGVRRIEQANKNVYSLRIGYPEAPSKSTFEFRLGSK